MSVPEVAIYPTSPTKFDIADLSSQGSNEEDNITFKVLGSATVSIGGAVIECDKKAEINIIRKKGSSRSPAHTISKAGSEKDLTVDSPSHARSSVSSFKSLVREGRDEASNRDSDEVLTNPHPWESDVDSRVPGDEEKTRPETTRISINASDDLHSGSDTSSKDTDSDSALSGDWYDDSLLSENNARRPVPQRPRSGKTRYICEMKPAGPVIHIETAGKIDNESHVSLGSWDASYSDEIEPSESASRPQLPLLDTNAANKQPQTPPGSRAMLMYRDQYPRSRYNQRRPPPPPSSVDPFSDEEYRAPPTSGYFGTIPPPEYPETECLERGNPFQPPNLPDRVVPPPPFNSTDTLDGGLNSTLNCVVGMMMWHEDLQFFPRTFSLDGEMSLKKYVSSTLSSPMRGPMMM